MLHEFRFKRTINSAINSLNDILLKQLQNYQLSYQRLSLF